MDEKARHARPIAGGPETLASGDKLLRLPQVLAPEGPIPVGRTRWWAGVRSGEYPAPVRLGAKLVAWRASDIAALVANGPAKPARPKG
jgi:predicted DNA-binding transcriptional regulator AlpA